MTKTQTTKAIRVNHVAGTVEVDGERFGTVVLRSGGWFQASRKHGDAVSFNRTSKFRSLERAIAWIESAAAPDA
jgi:hypothetical protein